MTKFDFSALAIPFTEFESFVTDKSWSMKRYFSQIIDRNIHLFINFVAILGYSGSARRTFIYKRCY